MRPDLGIGASVTIGVFFLCLSGVPGVANGASSITVDFDHSLGPVNRWVFGNNQVAYDPTIFGQPWHDAYSNYGAGLWDPEVRRIVPIPKSRAKRMGMTVSRFPGGMGAQIYDWKQAVGPVQNRPNWQFGPAEFLQTCADIGAIPLITISSFVGGPQDAADYVEYLNAPDDGAHPWAAVRAAQGHPQAYGVVYFEYDNECYRDWTTDQRLRDIQEYIDRFNAAAAAMKAVDANVKLGVVLTNEAPWTKWNELVLADAAARADFAVTHAYPTQFNSAYAPPGMTPEDLFRKALCVPAQVERTLARFNAEIALRSGRTDLQLAVTEFNSVLVGDEPAPYRLCLGNALLNAEYLRVLMQPAANLLMANHWQFINEYWGQIRGPERSEAIPYINRPAYLPFVLYRRHFGPTLLDVSVVCDSYETSGGYGVWPSQGAGAELTVLPDDLIAGRPWDIWPAPGVTVGQEPDLLTYTFGQNLPTYYSTRMLALTDILPGKTYRFSAEVKYSRNGESLLLYIGDSRGWAQTQSGRLSSAEWVWKDYWCEMHADYTTLADAAGLELILYRPGATEGDTVAVRNWAVHEIVPDTLPATPYLSVNASKSEDNHTVYLMVLNKKLDGAITAPVTVEGFAPRSMQAWVLNGPAIDSTNETDPDTVAVTASPGAPVGNGFEHTFPAHSLTALAIHDYEDADGDGLSAETEAALGTSPDNADSDGDGLSDGEEVNAYFTSPTIRDTDGDSISDGDEVNTYDTDPTAVDTDLDGSSDYAEAVLAGVDPNNPHSVGPDDIAPKADAISPITASPTNSDTVTFTVRFSEPVANFDADSDLVIAQTGTVAHSGVSFSGGPQIYTVAVEDVTGDGTIAIAVNPASDVQDPAGNPLAACATSATVSLDHTPPLVDAVMRADDDPTRAASVEFTVAFSEPVSGVDLGDFAVLNSGLTGPSVMGVSPASGSVYVVTVDTGAGDGTLGLEVLDDESIVDTAGNGLSGSFVSGEAYTVHKSVPLVERVARASGDPTNASSVAFTVAFNEPVTGVDKTDFALAATGVSGAYVYSVRGTGVVRTVTVATGTGNGAIRLDVNDDDSILNGDSDPLGGLGLGNGAYTAGETYTIDRTRPSVTVSSPAPSRTNLSPIPVIVTFSDSVTGFDAGRVTTVNASLINFAGSHADYTFDLVPAGDGSVSARVLAGTARDAAGNANLASNTLTRTSDTTPPAALSSTLRNPNPTNRAAVTFGVTFSENVTGVDKTDFALTTTGVVGAYVYSVSGRGAAYTVTVATGTGSGTIRLDVVDDDSIQDAAANSLGGSGAGNGLFTSGGTYTMDKTRPTVSMTSTAPEPANLSPIPVTVAFSEPVTGFAASDIVPATNAAVTNFVGSGANYRFDLTPLAPGAVKADIPSNRALDAAGNPNIAAPPFLRTCYQQ